LKGVENIDGLGESGDVDDAKRTCCVSNSDFPNARTDTLHWFPTVGIKSALNAIKLEPGVASCPVGERPQPRN
jgi:hypothetical protein